LPYIREPTALVVEKKGFEPSLSCLQSKRLTYRATSPSAVYSPA
jgi:hypothetical protein